MKIAPLIAIIFAFFLIAIYPIYSDDGIDENLSYSDEDNDGIPNDKDKCPEENASGKDIDEDGCIDSEITKEEVDYLERLAKINIGQYIIFAVVSLFSTAIYWERDRISALLTDKDELSAENYKQISGDDTVSKAVDYDELGKNREVKIQNNVSVYEGVELEDYVFCGPSMVFTNISNPRSAVIRRDKYILIFNFEAQIFKNVIKLFLFNSNTENLLNLMSISFN